MKIYIVMGTTGEYSDRSEWPVIAYKDEELAKDHVKYATQTANEIFNTLDPYNFDTENINNSYDPNMKLDFNGTSYFIYETHLWENERND